MEKTWLNTSGFTHVLPSLLLTNPIMIRLTGDEQRCNITTVVVVATFQTNIQSLPLAIHNLLTASVTKMAQSVKVDCSACESNYMPMNFTDCTGVKWLSLWLTFFFCPRAFKCKIRKSVCLVICCCDCPHSSQLSRSGRPQWPWCCIGSKATHTCFVVLTLFSNEEISWKTLRLCASFIFCSSDCTCAVSIAR